MWSGVRGQGSYRGAGQIWHKNNVYLYLYVYIQIIHLRQNEDFRKGGPGDIVVSLSVSESELALSATSVCTVVPSWS